MSEWLDLMIGEIARKTEEEKAALEEVARRSEHSAKDDQAAN